MENYIKKKSSNSSKRPLWVKLTIIFLSVVLGISLLFGGVIAYFRLPVSDYYKNSHKTFKIPKTSSGFIAQGLFFDEENNWFLATGYMKDKSASPVFIISASQNKTLKTAYLYKDSQTAYLGHCGGIAFYEDYIYIADGEEKCIYVFDYSALKSANDNEKLIALGTFSTKSDFDEIRPSFVEVYSNKLVVGEFYRNDNYLTHPSHTLTSPNEQVNHALAVEFSLNSHSYSETFGINPKPNRAYSIADKVQGMCFKDDKAFLSTSWGLSFSKIFVYDIKEASSKTATILDEEIPLYFLDSKNLITQIKAPPMSEEMAIVNDKLYIMNESASNKYIFGKFTGASHCYATNLDKYHLI